MTTPTDQRLIKPAPWNVSAGSTEGEFQSLWLGLSLAWPFWHESRAVDVSGHGIHGVRGAGISMSSWKGTPYGSGLLFDESDTESKVTAPDPPADRLDGGSTLSAEILCRPDTIAGGSTRYGLLSKYRPLPGQRSWRLYIEGDELELQVSSDGSVYESEKTTIVDLVAGNWYHIIFTYDGGVTRIWVNGTEFPLNDFSSATSIFAGGEEFLVGGRTSEAGSNLQRLDGVVASVRIWTRVLTPFEVRLLTTAPWGMYQAGVGVPSLALEHSGGAAAGPWQFAGSVAAGGEATIVSGLMNGTSYDIQLRTEDTSENISSGSTPVAGTPTAPTSSEAAWIGSRRQRTLRPILPPWNRQ